MIWWVDMFCDFESASREARLCFVALVDIFLARARLLPDPRETSLQRLADFMQVAIFQRSEASLNLLRVPLGGLEVYPIDLD
jgi:hypothetical protein